MAIVCENIKKFRKFRGLSQAELGEKIGRSKNVVSNWERGENEPDLDAIAAACKVLGVTPNQMFGWERHPEYDAFYKRMFVSRCIKRQTPHKCYIFRAAWQISWHKKRPPPQMR